MLRDEPPQPRGGVTHDGGTVVVRPSSSGGSGLNQVAGSTPGAVTDPKKAELLRKKQKQIEKLLNEARGALDAGDTESVFARCESVLMLDPDNMLAVELSEKAQTISERAKQQTLLADARTALGKFDFTRALQLVGEALVIDPTSTDALAVRKEIDAARKRKQQQELLAQELKARVENAKKLVAQQQFEKALEEAEAALQLDARNAEAIEVKQRAGAVVEERRAKEEAARQAKAREEQRKKEEAERKRQAEEQARIAREQEEQRKKEEEQRKKEEAERKRQAEEQARVAKQQEEEARRLKAQQDEARRRQQEELRRRQEAERKTQEAERRARESERKAQEAERKQPPAPDPEREIAVPAPVKKGGVSAVMIGGAAAAAVALAVAGYLVYGGRPGTRVPVDAAAGGVVAATPIAMTFTVTPYAHLELVGQNDPQLHKAACDASPSCVVALPPDVYNVHATNDFYKDFDFAVPVEAGKTDTFVRSFSEYKPEDEVNRLLSR
jgi:tetratricopeptide (TPR) repeat protein